MRVGCKNVEGDERTLKKKIMVSKRLILFYTSIITNKFIDIPLNFLVSNQSQPQKNIRDWHLNKLCIATSKSVDLTFTNSE